MLIHIEKSCSNEYYPLSFRLYKLISIPLSFVVIGINTFLVYTTVDDLELEWQMQVAVGIGSVLYFSFCIYLIIHMIALLPNSNLPETEFFKKYVIQESKLRLQIT